MVVLVALIAVTLFTMHTGNTMAQSSVNGDDLGMVRYWTPPQNSAVSSVLTHIKNTKGQAKNAGSATVPFWSSSFTFNGKKFPFTMVGSDPAAGSATTTIQPIIVPLSFTFSNGVTFDGSKKVQLTLASPLFQNAQFDSGNTQYGDAIQRAEFGKDIATTSPNYHVLFSKPVVLPSVPIVVPAQSGRQGTSKTSGKTVGLVDINFFGPLLEKLIGTLSLPPTVLPIFLTDDTFLFLGQTSQCCVLGFHDAVPDASGKQLHTFVESAVMDPGIFKGNTADITALSHEVSEWMNDPFGNNVVPNWQSPSKEQPGCSPALETGDPLSGTNFEVNGFHPQDEAFLSWFARETPSRGLNGRYTYLGTFTTLPTSC